MRNCLAACAAAALLGLHLAPVLAQDETQADTAVATDADADADAPLDTIALTPASPEAVTPTPRASASRLIEEIIVTAQKREENLQDVPLSVQAFSAESLDARGIDDPIELQNITPGLSYTQTASYSIIYIRGVGTDAFIPSADMSVATYIDGIYFPFSHGLAQNFGAVERVEVLKGPQGTLFGRNSTGGAISVITKKPSRDFEASVQTSYGNFDEFNTRAHVNIPLSETLALGVSAIYNRSDFYYDLTPDSPHVPLPPEVQKGARGRLQWSPVDVFDVTLSGLILQQQGTGNMLTQQENPLPRYEALGETRTANYESSVDAPVYFEARNPVIYGEANLRTDWVDFKLLGSRQEIRTNSLYDYDASKAPLVSFEADQIADVDTAELQLISNDTTWGADWFKWILGVYYINSTAGYAPVNVTAARDFAPDLLDPLVNPGDPENALAQLLADVGLDLSGLGTAINLPVTGLLSTLSTATFFQGSIDFTDWMAVTFGGRYQTETKRLDASRNQVQLTDTLALPAFTFAQQEEDTSNFSPKVSLDLRPMDDLLVYLSWSKGFKSGTYNIINIYAPSQFIVPEEVVSTEIGLKSQLFGGRVQFNAAVFNNDIDDLQVQFISLLTGGAARFETAPEARTRGVDFDILWQVAPDLLPGLVATATGAFVDAEYTDYQVASGFDEVTGLPFGGSGGVVGGGVTAGRDFSGNKIVRTPDFSGNAGLSYTFDAGPGSVEVAGDVYYNSGYFYAAQNLPSAEEKAFTLLNARMSYLYTPWNLRVTAFGKNLSDEAYGLTKLATDFGTSLQLAPPVTYGVRLNWDF